MTDINRSQGALKMYPSEPSQHKNFEHTGDRNQAQDLEQVLYQLTPSLNFIRMYYLFVCASMGRRGARVSTKARNTGSP